MEWCSDWKDGGLGVGLLFIAPVTDFWERRGNCGRFGLVRGFENLKGF